MIKKGKNITVYQTGLEAKLSSEEILKAVIDTDLNYTFVFGESAFSLEFSDDNADFELNCAKTALIRTVAKFGMARQDYVPSGAEAKDYTNLAEQCFVLAKDDFYIVSRDVLFWYEQPEAVEAKKFSLKNIFFQKNKKYQSQNGLLVTLHGDIGSEYAKSMSRLVAKWVDLSTRGIFLFQD